MINTIKKTWTFSKWTYFEDNPQQWVADYYRWIWGVYVFNDNFRNPVDKTMQYRIKDTVAGGYAKTFDPAKGGIVDATYSLRDPAVHTALDLDVYYGTKGRFKVEGPLTDRERALLADMYEQGSYPGKFLLPGAPVNLSELLALVRAGFACERKTEDFPYYPKHIVGPYVYGITPQGRAELDNDS